MSAPVDVLAVLLKLASFGGTFEPRRVVSERNIPRSTSTIRSHLRPATTAAVRSALREAEKTGDVESCADPAPGWNRSAADRAELYWKLSESALARVGGAS